MSDRLLAYDFERELCDGFSSRLVSIITQAHKCAHRCELPIQLVDENLLCFKQEEPVYKIVLDAVLFQVSINLFDVLLELSTLV